MVFSIFAILLIVPLYVDCNTNDKCYKVLRGLGPNCCNETPMVNRCNSVLCAPNKQCILQHKPVFRPENCSNDYFPLEPVCKQPCAMLKCAPYCIPTVGDDNCPSCYCEKDSAFKNPCEVPNACGDSEDCILRKVTCVTTPCYPVKECRPKCPPEEVCPENCLPYVDKNGCKKCHCCNACVNKKCSDGKKCVLNQVQCFVCPCPPLAECV